VPRNTKGLDAGSEEREVTVSGRDMQARRERSLALSRATTGLQVEGVRGSGGAERVVRRLDGT
jgi:hypothetical protein